jgi:hypothetical protein
MTPKPANMDGNQLLRRIVAYGLLPTQDYQKAKCCAEVRRGSISEQIQTVQTTNSANFKDLFKTNANLFARPEIHGMLEFKWAHWLQQKRMVRL